jgi:hypothetical protein
LFFKGKNRTKPKMITPGCGWPDLATRKRHTRLLNGAGAVHSLGCEEHVPIAFRFKNNKYIMKILKHPIVLLITQKYPC